MKQVSFQSVTLQDGFWKQKEELNRRVTIQSVWEQFEKSGRIEAFACDWKEGMEHKPHIFWDSDVAKWIEGAAYLIAKQPDETLTARIEWLIDQIEKNQDETGYFNIYFTVCEPEKRFSGRDNHELYCAGHLIEAAVAYFEATGKDRFLKLMMKYADYIKQIFMDERSAGFITCGHEEIELALIRLYRCTKQQRYLQLAEFFIDRRGETEDPMECENWLPSYTQSHVPVRRQETAEGHAVRACYLYCAMADLATETGDEALTAASEKLFRDIAEKKMYLTGGIGSTNIGEAFTVAYDLPNDIAYAETCAAIGLMLFARRMSVLKDDAFYQDVLERAMYNGMLSGISLDGTRFFYENPLEINTKNYIKYTSTKTKGRYPLSQRPEIFGCSCCPPNLNRILASMGNFCYGLDENTVFVHQFMASTMQENGVKVSQTTNYPLDGKVRLEVSGADTVKIRIPDWCDSFSLSEEYRLERGYAVVKNPGKPIEIVFDMKPRLIGASPRVWADAGKAAVQRGPVVYCLEGVDNGENLNRFSLDCHAEFTEEFCREFGGYVLKTTGWEQKDAERLYAPLSEQFSPVPLTMIPYHCFANRGETDMLVWMNYR